MGGVYALDVRRDRMLLLWSRRERALVKGFCFNTGDMKYLCICSRTKLSNSHRLATAQSIQLTKSSIYHTCTFGFNTFSISHTKHYMVVAHTHRRFCDGEFFACFLLILPPWDHLLLLALLLQQSLEL